MCMLKLITVDVIPTSSCSTWKFKFWGLYCFKIAVLFLKHFSSSHFSNSRFSNSRFFKPSYLKLHYFTLFNKFSVTFQNVIYEEQLFFKQSFWNSRSWNIQQSDLTLPNWKCNIWFFQLISGTPYNRQIAKLKCLVECDPLCSIIW
jgi:hypothetical protein